MILGELVDSRNEVRKIQDEPEESCGYRKEERAEKERKRKGQGKEEGKYAYEKKREGQREGGEKKMSGKVSIKPVQ